MGVNSVVLVSALLFCAALALAIFAASRLRGKGGEKTERALGQSRRDTFDARSRALADRFQAWDILDVYRDPLTRPEDDQEYDDLVQPMRSWLESGAGPEELSRRLTSVLDDDYGLGPMPEMAELDFTSELHSWWHSLERS